MKKAFVVPVPMIGSSLRRLFIQRLELLKKMGYDGVELAVQNPKQVNARSIKDLTNKYNIEVPAIATGRAYQYEGLSLSSPDDYTDQAVERIKDYIHFAANFSRLFNNTLTYPYVIIGLIRGEVEPGVGLSGAKKILKNSLEECLEYLRHFEDLSLVLEPINRYELNFLNTLDQTNDFLTQEFLFPVKLKPEVGILADTFHMNIEEKSIAGSLVKYQHSIRHIHLADSNRRAPGQGHIDFKEILRILKVIDYKGWLSVEIDYKPDFETAARQSIEYLKEIEKGV